MNSAEKEFDAVAIMRSIRDKVSSEIKEMALQEELDWLASQDLKNPFLRRLREKTVSKNNSTFDRSKSGVLNKTNML